MYRHQKPVSLMVEKRIAVLTIDNPPVNALDEQVIQQLDTHLEFLQAGNNVGVVIVTGAGNKAFVAGADINQFTNLDRIAGEAMVRKGQKIFTKLSQLPFPVICAVNGIALGGGCELALACDIRLVAENAKMGLPEVGLGIIPGYGGTQRLSRLVGLGKSQELIYSGEPIDAAEAYRIGLAERLVEEGQVFDEAYALANKIISKGPLAIAAAKKAINLGIEKSLPEGLEIEAALIGPLFESSDKNEGVQAFMEKRQANFQGK